MKKQTSKIGNKSTVTFSLPAEAVGKAREVLLLGDFNNWDYSKPFVLQRKKDGSFEKKVELPTGSDYQFRYLIDREQWENDWQADRYQPSDIHPHVENSVVCLKGRNGR
jgi:1,4-alpha-glucan branching enzyme